MKNYEINLNTCLIKGENNKSEIIETDKSYYVEKKPTDIINYSCEYFGSSLEGRIKGSKRMLGMLYKLPIIVEESNEIVFMPTTSIRQSNCWWINIANIKNYKSKGDQVEVEFVGGKTCDIQLSYFSFENQLFRATKLLILLQKRKKTIKK